MTTRNYAYFATTKGVYTPPIGHKDMRISIVYIPLEFDRIRIGQYIGKDGKHLIRMTEESGVDYMWYESESHRFEIWSKDEISMVHAVHLLEQHWQQQTHNHYGPLIVDPIRITVIPNYPQITGEVMQNFILPHLLAITDYLPLLRKMVYNPQRNFYEIWSYNETTTNVAMSILHDILTSVSTIPLMIPPPPPVYFARSLDTPDFETLESMRQNGQQPDFGFFLRSSLH
uniref:K Homology domain-containing protein n=1 Tax=viral metagenome TaxID=1070528 RepID=A0A6C0D057_9ZZZZ